MTPVQYTEVSIAVKTSAHRGYDVNGDVSNWSCISESDRGANASASLPATSAGNASSKSMEVEMKEDGHDGRREFTQDAPVRQARRPPLTWTPTTTIHIISLNASRHRS